MSTLLLRLAAPMQSWGCGSKFDTRMTQREPTKSGVLGMLAAAAGVRRDDTDALKELSRLKFGVRVDREGTLLHDFHMVHAEKASYVTHRYYLCDAVFLCGLESDDDETLQRLCLSLTHPVYPLFLGRRSCPPTLPVVLGVRSKDLASALEEEPRLVQSEDDLRIVTDAGQDDPGAAVVKDVPLSFSPYRREFGYRRFQEKILPGNRQEEHDPFAELEEIEQAEHDPFAELEEIEQTEHDPFAAPAENEQTEHDPFAELEE